MLLIQVKTNSTKVGKQNPRSTTIQKKRKFIRHQSGSHPRQHSCMKICREISTTNDLKETMTLSAVLKNFITVGHKVSDHQLHHHEAAITTH
jgi:hypothetical protein